MQATIPIAASASQPPTLILPSPASHFSQRAQRLEQLAQGHALGDFLQFMAALARAQHAALQQLAPPGLPDAASLERARAHGMPPLAAQSLPRDAAWHSALHWMLDALAPTTNAASAALLAELRALPAERLEAMAARILDTDLSGPDARYYPLLAAALQVYWVKLVTSLPLPTYAPLDVHNICPACGCLPLGSVIGAHADVSGLRYAQCALCGTQWNVTRASCLACGAGEDRVGYHSIEGSKGPMQAESCDECHSYFKLLRRDQDASADLTADDLASLTLDMLLDDAGFARGGPNLLFVPGES
ncbi:MAG: formate dehydrogenase accessory protein FdhE [Burkholderiales bacterium]|nr:formate dehydrogenase accessory protein FdhE [Burkholderiales bacterium]